MNTMKIIHSIIGILIILIGALFMSITVYDEEFKTITYKVFGSFTLLAGVFYLKRIAKFGKQ